MATFSSSGVERWLRFSLQVSWLDVGMHGKPCPLVTSYIFLKGSTKEANCPFPALSNQQCFGWYIPVSGSAYRSVLCARSRYMVFPHPLWRIISISKPQEMASIGLDHSDRKIVSGYFSACQENISFQSFLTP